MLEALKEYQFLVGALTGSVAAFILGLIVTHHRRERTWLGFSVNTRNIVNHGHTNLSMKFDQRDIKRLDSHAVVLRNVGNRPLKNLPIRISSKGGEIVEHEFTKPDGMVIESAFKSANELLVTCDLINAGEAITVGLTVADSENGTVKVVARAENLSVKDIGESINASDVLDIALSTSGIYGILGNAIASSVKKLFR